MQPVGQALAGDPSGGEPRPIPIYQVESLAFGALNFTGVSTTPITLGGPLAGLDGIIGIGFFQDFLLTFDYPGGRLSAGPGALPAANGADILDFTLERGLITIPLASARRRIRSISIPATRAMPSSCPRPRFRPCRRAAKRGAPASLARSAGRMPLQEIDLAAPVRFGTTRLPVTAVAFPAIGGLGNIGSLALQRMVVSVDQPNRACASRRAAESGAGASFAWPCGEAFRRQTVSKRRAGDQC